MEKPNRKPNRLHNFDYGEAGSYFITLCTHNRARLFHMENAAVGNDLCVVPDEHSTTARRPFPTGYANGLVHKWVKETQNKYEDMTIDLYVVMPDHLHFLISIQRNSGVTIEEIMRYFKTMTTNAYIRRVKSGELPPFDKKIWQKSYYDHVVRNQQDYNEIWEYITNNPQKWTETHPP